MFADLHDLFAQVTRQYDLQMMAQRAMQAAEADPPSEDGQRYAQLVARLSTRLGIDTDDVELRIKLLAMGVPT